MSVHDGLVVGVWLLAWLAIIFIACGDRPKNS